MPSKYGFATARDRALQPIRDDAQARRDREQAAQTAARIHDMVLDILRDFAAAIASGGDSLVAGRRLSGGQTWIVRPDVSARARTQPRQSLAPAVTLTLHVAMGTPRLELVVAARWVPEAEQGKLADVLARETGIAVTRGGGAWAEDFSGAG